MRVHRLIALGIAVLVVSAAGHSARREPREVQFRKIVLHRGYVSEGGAVADVNRDGKLDIMAGNLWFEAPDWKEHEIAPVPKLDAAVDHANSYVNWAADLNGDGWPDQLVIGRPGTPLVWRENPGKKGGPWPEHPYWRSACNESPQMVDLLANGTRQLLFAYDNSVMAWFELGSNPAAGPTPHDISTAHGPATDRYSHGLGLGDINGDGRADVLCHEGFWIAPADPRNSPWKFWRANLGPECAQMYVYDFNGDGLPDVVSSSAHNKGVWWYEQRRGRDGPVFIQHTIDESFSQSHSLQFVDINGDGKPDLVTGKRWWAHGPTGDVEPNAPAVLVWYEFQGKSREPKWIKHVIDDDSGIGVQFEVRDINGDGLPDIIIANKKGIFLFLQQR